MIVTRSVMPQAALSARAASQNSGVRSTPVTCTSNFAAIQRAGPPIAAADIEQALAGKRLEQRDQLLGRQHAAAVEMVDRRQRLRGDRRVRAVDLAQRREDPVGDAAAAVMLCDRVRCRHAASSPWISAAAMLRQRRRKNPARERRDGRQDRRMQPEGMNVRMQQGKPAYSHVVTVTGPAQDDLYRRPARARRRGQHRRPRRHAGAARTDLQEPRCSA